MPSKPRKICSKPGCRELTADRYCAQHKGDNNRYYDKYQRNQEAKAFYHSLEWRRAREQALIRDHGLCQHCLRDKQITTADMVHHIKPIKTHWHLRLLLSNLLSLCNSCHNKIDHSKG